MRRFIQDFVRIKDFASFKISSFISRIAERLSVEFYLEEIDDLQYVEEERLNTERGLRTYQGKSY